MIATNVAARVSRRSSLERTAWDSVRAVPVLGSGAETVAIPSTVAAIAAGPPGAADPPLRKF